MTWPTFKNILWLLSEMQTDIAEVAIYGYFPFLMCDVVNWIWGEQQMVVVASWWFQLQWGLESFMLHVEPSWFNFLSPFTLSLYHWDLIQIFDIPMHLLQNMQKGSQCNVGKLWQAWHRSMDGVVLQRYCSPCVREILVYIAGKALAIHDRLPRGPPSQHGSPAKMHRNWKFSQRMYLKQVREAINRKRTFIFAHHSKYYHIQSIKFSFLSVVGLYLDALYTLYTIQGALYTVALYIVALYIVALYIVALYICSCIVYRCIVYRCFAYVVE